MEHDFINKEQQSLHNIMLAINRLISLNVYWILFFTDGVYNYNNQILLLQEGNVNKDRKKRKEKVIPPSHTQILNDHAEDPEYAYTRQPKYEYSTSFSFPSTWNCTHTVDHKEHRVTAQGIQQGGMWLRSGDENREGVQVWSLFLQCTEGVLHVLQQLGVFSLDLSLAILQWVLWW